MIPRRPQGYIAPAETPSPKPTAEPFSLVERIATMALAAGVLLMICVALFGYFNGLSILGLTVIVLASLTLALAPRKQESDVN